MTDKLQIDLVGADALLVQIERTASRMERPRELMEAIGAQLEGNVEQRFKSKTDAAGQAWAPISPTTAEIYERIHGKAMPGSLLERSGHMRDALAHNATDEYVEVGFGGSAPYAIYHVTGTKKMPRRDPLFGLVNTEGTQGELGAQDTQDVLDLMESFMEGGLR